MSVAYAGPISAGEEDPLRVPTNARARLRAARKKEGEQLYYSTYALRAAKGASIPTDLMVLGAHHTPLGGVVGAPALAGRNCGRGGAYTVTNYNSTTGAVQNVITPLGEVVFNPADNYNNSRMPNNQIQFNQRADPFSAQLGGGEVVGAYGAVQQQQQPQCASARSGYQYPIDYHAAQQAKVAAANQEQASLLKVIEANTLGGRRVNHCGQIMDSNTTAMNRIMKGDFYAVKGNAIPEASEVAAGGGARSKLRSRSAGGGLCAVTPKIGCASVTVNANPADIIVASLANPHAPGTAEVDVQLPRRTAKHMRFTPHTDGPSMTSTGNNNNTVAQFAGVGGSQNCGPALSTAQNYHNSNNLNPITGQPMPFQHQQQQQCLPPAAPPQYYDAATLQPLQQHQQQSSVIPNAFTMVDGLPNTATQQRRDVLVDQYRHDQAKLALGQQQQQTTDRPSIRPLPVVPANGPSYLADTNVYRRGEREGGEGGALYGCSGGEESIYNTAGGNGGNSNINSIYNGQPYPSAEGAFPYYDAPTPPPPNMLQENNHFASPFDEGLVIRNDDGNTMANDDDDDDGFGGRAFCDGLNRHYPPAGNDRYTPPATSSSSLNRRPIGAGGGNRTPAAAAASAANPYARRNGPSTRVAEGETLARHARASSARLQQNRRSNSNAAMGGGGTMRPQQSMMNAPMMKRAPSASMPSYMRNTKSANIKFDGRELGANTTTRNDATLHPNTFQDVPTTHPLGGTFAYTNHHADIERQQQQQQQQDHRRTRPLGGASSYENDLGAPRAGPMQQKSGAIAAARNAAGSAAVVSQSELNNIRKLASTAGSTVNRGGAYTPRQILF